MLSRKKLLASHWSIAGDTFPTFACEVSPFAFQERAETAAAVGFTGLGLVHEELLSLKESLGYPKVRAIMERNGLKTLEVEILSDWFAEGERRRASDAMRRDLLEAADALGARHIKVSGDMSGTDWPTQVLADSFGALCLEAEKVGALVGIEIMPWSNFATIPRTMEVVEAAGQRNGGLLMDIWHLARGNIDFAELGGLPKEAIVSVEIDDAPEKAAESLWEDTLHNRLPPGEGSFEITRFLAEVEKTGYDGPVGVEIISTTHRKLALRQAAEVAYRAAAQFLA
jgi:sugar phosphate isomerase/epimerase